MIDNDKKEWLKKEISRVYGSIHESKFEEQIQTIGLLKQAGFKGLIEWATGVGKTMVAILFIMLMNKADVRKKTIVVVPTIKLANDWTGEGGHIEKFGLINVEVYVVNTYTTYDLWVTDLLVCDEVHQYSNPETKKFSKVIGITQFKYFVGLSATLEEDERKYLLNHGVKLISKINLREAEQRGYVSPNLRFSVPIYLSDENRKELDRIQDIFNKSFSVFRNNFPLAQACGGPNMKPYKVYFSEYDERTDTYELCNREDYDKKVIEKTGDQWRKFWAFVLGWDGTSSHEFSPDKIRARAGEFAFATRERVNILNKGIEKVDFTEKLVKALSKKTIIFCENTSIADDLAKRIENSRAYHSNISSQVIWNDKIIGHSVRVFDDDLKKDVTKYYIPSEKREYSMPDLKKRYSKVKTISKDKVNAESLRMFEEDEISVLVTAKALDEGADIKNLECAIVLSGTSKERQQTQREGRTVRYSKNKIAYIFNLFYKNTSDEYKLKNRIQGKAFIEEGNIDRILNIIENAKTLYSNKTNSN